MRRLILTLLCLVLPCATALAQLQFKVTLDPASTADTAVSGRLIVMMTQGEVRAGAVRPGFGDDTDKVWVTAREISRLAPGESVLVYPDELAFPTPFSKAPVGNYMISAELDVDHNAAYNFASAGDLQSSLVQVANLNPSHTGTVELTLRTAVPRQDIHLTSTNHRLERFLSPSLSEFWGRPIYMEGIVVLPENYQSTQDRYPTVYVNHGYGAQLPYYASHVAPKVSNWMQKSGTPQMIYVLLMQSCPGGTHEFVDSKNNGPWGHALIQEFIPYLESKYRMDAKPSGRLLTGHSSGGWATAWLQIAYPSFFGGAWATSPDPVDFHNFTGPDIASVPPQNFYRDLKGAPFMLVRMENKDVESLEQYAKQERILGEYGGQMASFEWVFSPRGADGRPMQLFNRETGAVDPAVARYWEDHYDISHILATRHTELAPLLRNKLHIIVGTADTFHLEGAVRLLEKNIAPYGYNARIEYLPGRTHFDLYEGGLEERIAKEMYEVARPAAAR